jgi:hypothetical protein
MTEDDLPSGVDGEMKVSGDSFEGCLEGDLGGAPVSKPVYPVPPPTDHLGSNPSTHATSDPLASSATSIPRSVATPPNQIPLQVPLYSTLKMTPSGPPIMSCPLPNTTQVISPLTSLTPTRLRPSFSATSTFLDGVAQRMRMRSVLGNVPCIPQPSAKPAVDESEDSSSARSL